MKCSDFELAISRYLDGELHRQEGSEFRAHALVCRQCRALLDDVGQVIEQCNASEEINPTTELDELLVLIASNELPFDCAAYQSLITEFLDGFVPAFTYHKFETHAAECAECSALLTDVVYAVAACHGVHTYESFEPSSELESKLTAISTVRRRNIARVLSDRVRAFADSWIPATAPASGRSFAMGLSLAALTFAFLLFGFSSDGSVGGIYRQARVKATEFYDRGARAYSEKERVAAKFERVKSDIDEIWETLGGTDSSGSPATVSDGSSEGGESH